MEPRENNQHNFSASICRKKTFTGLYTKWDSFTPRKYKINLICTLALSCYRICLCPLLLQSSLSSWNAFICIPGDPCMSLYFKGHASYYFISRDKKKLSFRPGHLKDLKRWGGGGVPAKNLGGVSRWAMTKPLLGTRPGNSNLTTQLFKKTCWSFFIQFLY